MPIVVAEKVLVSTISAPTSKYFACISAIASGWVMESKSLFPLTEVGKCLNRSPR